LYHNKDCCTLFMILSLYLFPLPGRGME